MRIVALVLVVASSTFALGQADPAKLTLDRIFASGEFSGERVPSVRWQTGGTYLSTQASTDTKNGRDLIRVDAATGKVEILVPAAKLIPPGTKEPLSIQGYDFSADLDRVLIFTNSVKVWRANTRGDYWVYRRSTDKLTRLGGDAKPSTLMFAKFSPDGSQVGYVRDHNLYVEPSDGGPVTRLTVDGTDQIINGTFDWVYEEEFKCRDGWRWSPDGLSIAYWQVDARNIKSFPLINNTSGSYPTITMIPYPKAGEQNSACKIGVVSTKGGPTKWVDIPGDTRNDYYLPRMDFAGNPTELIIRRVNRLQNAVDVMMVDLTSGASKTILTERDGAWVDVEDDAGEWLDKGANFTWISERDGWRHLYVASRDGSNLRRVTSGAYDVIEVLRVDEKAGVADFYASPDNATQQYLYRIPLTGSAAPTRLTPADQPGWHTYNIAPDGTHAVHTYSRFDSPPRVEIITLPDHKVVRVLASNDELRSKIEKLAHSPVEFLKLDAGVGVTLDGWLMKPVPQEPGKKYPLLFHVYGEPAGQTVTDRWGGDRYLWHLMLTQMGYAVASIDNRGTPAPKGRDWRKSVYRKIGVVASKDQAAATRDLLKLRPWIDPERIGVWGWSGGGSMTLNLLLRSPDLYRTGMSVAPVPDMRLYDTIYQERYMGLPQENAEDYRQGSPITHAEGLKGNLLIVHGTGDDNVHYQGAELMANRLIELNKPFLLMPYPNRSHSINEGKNTTRHLYSLLTRYLTEHLPAGPKP